MTYPNDPHNRTPERNTNYGWIIGGLVAVAVVFGIFTMYRHNNNYTAPVAERGTITAPTTNAKPVVPATTGSAVTDVPTAPAVPVH
jgi:hypothetical protein